MIQKLLDITTLASSILCICVIFVDALTFESDQQQHINKNRLSYAVCLLCSGLIAALSLLAKMFLKYIN